MVLYRHMVCSQIYVEQMNSIDAAKRLLQEKNEIMRRWEKLVRSEFTEAQRETKLHLINSLPEFLDLIIDALTRAEVIPADLKKIKQVSQEHAEDRALFTRYTIEHILREYEFLRRVIFETMEDTGSSICTPVKKLKKGEFMRHTQQGGRSRSSSSTSRSQDLRYSGRNREDDYDDYHDIEDEGYERGGYGRSSGRGGRSGQASNRSRTNRSARH